MGQVKDSLPNSASTVHFVTVMLKSPPFSCLSNALSKLPFKNPSDIPSSTI